MAVPNFRYPDEVGLPQMEKIADWLAPKAVPKSGSLIASYGSRVSTFCCRRRGLRGNKFGETADRENVHQ